MNQETNDTPNTNQNKYSAFVLAESTRQSLIKAIGGHFAVRVCHHVTVGYDFITKSIQGLQEMIDNKQLSYAANGVFIGEDYVTILVEEIDHRYGERKTDKRLDGKKYHITYERKRNVTDAQCIEILDMKQPFRFIPLHLTLEGSFELLEKGGKTPVFFQDEKDQHFIDCPATEIGLDGKHHPLDVFDDIDFGKSEFIGNGIIVLSWSSKKYPLRFMLRNKNGPSQQYFIDHPLFPRLLRAWCKKHNREIPSEFASLMKLQNKHEINVSEIAFSPESFRHIS